MGLLALFALLAAGGAAALGAGQLGGSIADRIDTDNFKKDLRNQGFSESEIDEIVNRYHKNFNISDLDSGLDRDAFKKGLEDYNSWKDKIGAMPDYVDEEAINNLANQQIDSENAQIQALYDQMLDRSTDLYRTELNDMNTSYNDYINQLMSNQAQATNVIAGSTRSELQRSQRNAISRGATAAMRLVSNINTELGLQNKAAQQSLDTSNNLAQMLLTQRQSAAQLRSQYAGDMNDYTANTANLMSGTAERKASYRDSMRNEAYSNYQNKMDRWENNLNSYAGDSPWGSIARNRAIRNRTTNNSLL